ncbi:vegetative cell wall protein gp1-like isoform X2 [Numida meleagris]|uniref:vegetative cell wall protein gp1-like isoform X2 n=1 Tax=Numida meleagris TaxID=8996 RepID=UPI000B3DE53C|nr:vegetative cell wall protein gp1-like isoform X2 [Numida meleagris]
MGEAAGSVPCHGPTLQTKVFKYRIWDMNQQSLYLRDDQLVAGHLQGANAALEGERALWGHGGTRRGGGLTLLVPPQRRFSGCPTAPSSRPGSPSSWASGTEPAAWPAPLPHSPPCSSRTPTSRSCPVPAMPRRRSPSSAPTRTGCGASSRPPTPAGSSAPRRAPTSPWASPAAPTPPTSSTSTSSCAEPGPVQ